MKTIEVSMQYGEFLITFNHSFLWWKWKDEYIGLANIVGYWRWRKLPNFDPVTDRLYLQLDSLAERYIKQASIVQDNKIDNKPAKTI